MWLCFFLFLEEKLISKGKTVRRRIVGWVLAKCELLTEHQHNEGMAKLFLAI